METKDLIKGGLLTVGILLVNTGIALVWNPDRIWAGVVVLALGVIAVMAREVLKKFVK